MTAKRQQGIGSIEAGLKLLKVFERAGRPLGLSEAANIAGMSASNAHRYLVSFAREGMIVQDQRTALYGLGSFALHLGLAAMSALDYVAIGTDALLDLRAELDMSVFLSIWTDRGPTMIRWLDASQPITVNVKPGFRAPLLTSASGLVFLGFRGREEVWPLAEREMQARRALGADSLVTKEEVEALTEEVRAVGLGWVRGERVPGIYGLSVPLFDMNGNAALSLTAVGLNGTFNSSFDGPVGSALRSIGERASRHLGHRL